MSTQSKKTSGTQKAVKIDDQLFYDLDEWLQTDEAKKLGYHSKAQFTNEAVSKLLLEKRKIQFTNITILENEGKIMMIDNGLDIHMDPRVEIWMKKKDSWDCATCDDDNCIHIKAVKESAVYREFVEKTEGELSKEYEDEKTYEAADMAGMINSDQD